MDNVEVTWISAEQRKLDFANRAVQWFEEHPDHWSYTNGEIEPGCFFAIRWGPTGQAVLTFQIADERPVVYADCIKTPPYPRVKEAVPGAGRMTWEKEPNVFRGPPPGP